MSGFALHSQTCGLGSVQHLRHHQFSSALQPHRLVARRRSLATRAAIVAKPASIDIKTFDGSSSGSQDLALKVAARDTAKGLVHRYLVTVRQNARAVWLRAVMLPHQLKSRAILRGCFAVAGNSQHKNKGRSSRRWQEALCAERHW